MYKEKQIITLGGNLQIELLNRRFNLYIRKETELTVMNLGNKSKLYCRIDCPLKINWEQQHWIE